MRGKPLPARVIIDVCLEEKATAPETLKALAAAGYAVVPKGLERERNIYAKALESISKNTCCDKCQEAALVASSALDAAGIQFEGQPRFETSKGLAARLEGEK